MKSDWIFGNFSEQTAGTDPPEPQASAMSGWQPNNYPFFRKPLSIAHLKSIICLFLTTIQLSVVLQTALFNGCHFSIFSEWLLIMESQAQHGCCNSGFHLKSPKRRANGSFSQITEQNTAAEFFRHLHVSSCMMHSDLLMQMNNYKCAYDEMQTITWKERSNWIIVWNRSYE